MLLDANTLPEDSEIETDLCIIGGGVAGITLAHLLLPQDIDIVLLESGDLEYDDATQELYDGAVLGTSMASPLVARLRYFGGSSNHWTGYCRPLDPRDFERREWVPNSGWPLTYETLAPYYERSIEILDLKNNVFDPNEWHDEMAQLFRLPSLADTATTQIFQLSAPTRFGDKYREEMENASTLRGHLNANVVDIETDHDARTVQAVRVGTIEGRRYRVKAQTFVLATGGIENARLLLAANNVSTGGLGNEHDLVGRYFMDHPSAAVATLFFDAETDIATPPFPRSIATGFGLPLAVREREHVLNFNCNMHIQGTYTPDGYVALREIFRQVSRGNWPEDWRSALGDVFSDLDGTVAGVWDRLFRTTSALRLDAGIEVVPNPESRVLLTTERDALGMPRIAVDWRLTELDYHSLRKGVELLGAAFTAAGLGRVRLDEDFLTESFAVPAGSYHHLGTTRMADDPRQGVVDRDCRVHGMSNLYVAGSSVFPTSGYANPTMTIVALTLRLADHLRERKRD